MQVKEKLIARVGLGAAAFIFAASLGILIVQARHNNGVPIRTLEPAQIEPSPSAAPAAVQLPSSQADAQHGAVSVGS
jgi:hypothetical protein